MIKIQRVLKAGAEAELDTRLDEHGLTARIIPQYQDGLIGYTAPEGESDIVYAVYDKDVVINAIAGHIQAGAAGTAEPCSDDDAIESANDEFFFDASYRTSQEPTFVFFCGERSMSFEDYQANAARTAQGFKEPGMLANWGLGLAGEAGEVVEVIKKHLFHGKDLPLDDLKKELGDVLWYIAAICSEVGINLDDVAEHNIEKLASRYPTGFVKGGGKR